MTKEPRRNIYKVILEIKPGVRFDKSLQIVLPDGSFHFDDILRSTSRKPIGIRITAEIQETTREAAENKAKSLVTNLTSLISFNALVGLPEPLLVKSYEITPKKTQGDFIQYYYDLGVLPSSIRIVNRNRLSKAVNAMNKKTDSEIIRISRAIHWFHDALHSLDALDRYTSLWIGLETLNPLLREYYKLPIEKTSCVKCGHETFQTMNGIRQLFKELYPTLSIWSKNRKLRADTVHGLEDFSKIIPKVKKMTPYLEEALIRGLDTILNQGIRDIQNLVSLSHPRPVYLSFKSQIVGPDLGLLDSEIEPDISGNFNLETIDSPVKLIEHQKVTTELNVSIDSRFKFKGRKVEVHTMEHIAKYVDIKIK